MPRYVFDIETNGLLDVLDTVHCIVLQNIDTKETHSATDNEYAGGIKIKDALTMLEQAELVVGHNVLTFDIPALQKVYPSFKLTGTVRDTLLMSRLIWPDIYDRDYSRLTKDHDYIPVKLAGKHRLEAWGYRLGIYKGEFGKTTDWSAWSPEMQMYCEQDTNVTLALWQLVESRNYSEQALEIEHQFQQIIAKQERSGIPFDVKKAQLLYAYFCGCRNEIEGKLQEVFPSVVSYTKTGKRKEKAFNPASRKQIAERLIEKYGWKPEFFTPTGAPEVSEEVLDKLDYPEAKLLSDYLMIEKRIGMLGEGKNAWLKCVDDQGLIHGSVITAGAITRRCTHHSPNMAQVPAVGAPFGKECRELFYAPEGWVMLGADASGLELRCLAHYMSAFDDGKYAHILLNGDIHTANQEAAGLPTRALAKRFIYAFLYGAGYVKLGSIVEPTASEKRQEAIGKKLKASFLKKTPALKTLIDRVQYKSKDTKTLRAIDGGLLRVRSQHSALNTLLQSCGAIVMKLATVILWQELEEQGLAWGWDVIQVAHIHDEYQLLVRDGLQQTVGPIAVDAIRKAGEVLKMRCPLDGEWKVGRNWAETH